MRNTKLDEDMMGSARRLAAVMAHFRRVNPNIPAQVIHYFLHAAAHPGESVIDVGRAIGMSKAASHRAYQALTEDQHWDHRSERPGMGLLFSTPNPSDARVLAVYLTAKGRRLLEEADKAVYGSRTSVHATLRPTRSN